MQSSRHASRFARASSIVIRGRDAGVVVAIEAHPRPIVRDPMHVDSHWTPPTTTRAH
jgi:hypothetical protein